MSRSSPAPASPDFWRAFARLALTRAPVFMWERAAGPAFPFLSHFLRGAPGSPPSVAPCSKCGAARPLIAMPDGTFLLDRPSECSACTPERGLPRDLFLPIQLDLPKLALAVASALSLDAPAAAPQARGPLLPLGTFDHGPSAVPTFLSLVSDLHDPRHLSAIEPLRSPCALILPLPSADELAALRSRGLWIFRAASRLQVWPGGRIRGVSTLADAVADLLAGTAERAPHPPLALAGARFVIAPDYSSVTALRPRRRTENVSNSATRAALQVLVEAGAGSTGTALLKAQFVARVHSLTHPDRPPPANPKPAHYFRRAMEGKLRAYGFYKQLVRWTPGGGAYWLEI